MAEIKNEFHNSIKENIKSPAFKKIATILIGTAILSFGLHNIHQQTKITEGGVLGMILLLNHWFELTPALISPVLDIICYIFAFKALGKEFIKTSAISTLSLAGFFLLWEQFPPILPNLSNHPLIAAVAGGLLVGVGVGLVVRQGGSTGGDDALALAISKITGCNISIAYLATDISVLLLSLSYIPFKHIIFSIITVSISSFVIGFIKDFSINEIKPTKDEKNVFNPKENKISKEA